MPDEKGETRRERNEKYGEPVPDPEVPEQAAHVWAWFFDLSAQRRSGPESLSFGEIADWQQLTGTMVRPEEVRMILAMDSAYVSAMRKEQRDMQERMRQTTKPKKG